MLPSRLTTSSIKAELHSHSTFSDGQYSPSALLQMCQEQEVALWALTDHDTCEGCLEVMDHEAFADTEVSFIPGVEVSAREEVSIHVLGYGLDPRDATLRAFFATRKEERESRMERMIALANKRGFMVTLDEVMAMAPDGNLARPHLARALVDRGYVESVEQAFDRYLQDGGPLYVASPWLTVRDAIALIQKHRGVAVLAHPGPARRDGSIAAWVEQGLEGIEARHPSHSDEQAHHYAGVARRHGLLVTGSSDFHGPLVAPDRHFGRTQLDQGWVSALIEAVSARGGLVFPGR